MISHEAMKNEDNNDDDNNYDDEEGDYDDKLIKIAITQPIFEWVPIDFCMAVDLFIRYILKTLVPIYSHRTIKREFQLGTEKSYF